MLKLQENIARRYKVKLIEISPAAQHKLAEIKALNPDIKGLHISLEKGGCAGMEYRFALVNEVPENVETVEEGSAKIFIARDSLLYILGSILDFQKTLVKTSFILQNPNQTAACGCGESVSITPAAKI